VVTGIAFVSICLLHGATFVALKTTGDLRERARWVGRVLAPATGLIVVIWISWTRAIARHGTLLNPIELATWIAAIAGPQPRRRVGVRRDHRPLTVMTVVAVSLLPFVLAYQSWTYYVFRRRVGRQDFTQGSPAAPARSSLAWNDGRSAGDGSDGPRNERQRS
jgi:cytochrome d ubiquinol oxidase subunit II